MFYRFLCIGRVERGGGLKMCRGCGGTSTGGSHWVEFLLRPFSFISSIPRAASFWGRVQLGASLFLLANRFPGMLIRYGDSFRPLIVSVGLFGGIESGIHGEWRMAGACME